MAIIDLRIRDAISKFLPTWLSNRVRAGLTVGFRFVWAMVAPLDALLDMAYQALLLRYPGLGTPTALPYHGRSRGILRGQDEPLQAYLARLSRWLDTWEDTGSDELVITAIHEFLRTHPAVTIITRGEIVGGVLQPSPWITIGSDGVITRTEGLWDWDSASHPERNDEDDPWWSEQWIIVHPSQWTERPGTLGDMGGGDDGFAIGHMATHEEVDAVLGLLALRKAAHNRIRTVIFTTDPDLFDPTDQDTCPNGNWGDWSSYDVDGNCVPSDRNTATCRYWEPE